MNVNKNRFIYGFDYLRIILCIGVVALHSNIFTLQNQYIGSSINPLYYRLLLYNFFWACVPTFILISLYLYIGKSYKDSSYFKKRIKQLAIIYVFWLFIHTILNNYGNISFIKKLNLRELFLLLIGNDSIIYFLFNLIYMTIFTEIIIRLYKKYKCKKIYFVLFLISLVSMFFSIFFINKIGFSMQFVNDLSFSNPLLFVPYSFSALYLYLLLQNNSKEKIKKVFIICLILFIIFGVIDWILRINELEFLKYNYESLGRPSLVFEAITLVIIFSSNKFKNNKIISFISSLTMGIFLIHTIILNYLGLNLSTLNININGLSIFLITLLFSFLIITILKKAKHLI